jgi:hypothetical protein
VQQVHNCRSQTILTVRRERGFERITISTVLVESCQEMHQALD